jgi:hypothetical protein
MIVSVLIFLLLATGWTALLWFAVAPMFAGWNAMNVVALHAGPPLLAGTLWWLIRLRLRRREQAQAALREAHAAEEREAARAALRAAHQQELARRRTYCDCRAVVTTILCTTIDRSVAIDAVGVQIRHEVLHDATTPTSGSALDRFASTMSEDLALLYGTCKAATFFPIYVVPPAELPGEEVLKRIRTIRNQLAEELGIPGRAGSRAPQTLFLPAGDNTPNRILSLFEAAPDLPGAVVLAFDGHVLRPGLSEDVDETRLPEYIEREKFAGKPAQGVATLLVTNPRLPAMLESLSETQCVAEEEDSLTPFWQRSEEPDGYAALLGLIPAAQREELASLPILARIHQAPMKEGETRRQGVLDMTRLAQAVIDNARVNAGLAEPPAMPDGDSNEAAESTEPGRAFIPCQRLIHNAGGVDVAGKRLAALGSALLYFGIDLNPVDNQSAVNITTGIGDAGLATPIIQLALAVAHVAKSRAAVVCAEFCGDRGLAVSFMMPPQA